MRPLSLALLLAGCLHLPAFGQLVICPGEPVQFELDQTYYGEKTWEYSEDSVSWNPVVITEQEPFVLAPEQAGYYRVSFHDVDCDTTYLSNVVRFRFPAPVQLLSFFEDHSVADGVNPVFWLDRYAELTNVVYVLNGIEYPSMLQFEMLPNPGSNFSIYATAADASGCTVHSDTLLFTVFNSDLQGTGSLQTIASITTDDIVITSSIDTVSVINGQPFDVLFSLDYGNDMIVAQRSESGSLGPVVAMQLAVGGVMPFDLSEESTLVALVLSQPDVAFLALENYDQVAAWLASQPGYNAIRDQFVADLTTTGRIDLENPSLPALVNGLVIGILTDLVPQLMGGINPVSPELTVDQSQPSQLSYDHDFNNLGYVARAYQNNSPISGAMIFPGVWHPSISSMTANIKSLLCSILQLDVDFDLVSSNGKFPITALTADPPFAEIDMWLVNGEGFAHAYERDMAEQYNSFIFMHRVFTGWLPGAVLKKLGGSDGGALACVGVESAFVLDQLDNAPQPATSAELTAQFGQYAYQVVGCAYPQPPEWLDLLLNLTGLSDIGFMFQFNWDRHYKEAELIYTVTKVGSQWMGKLVVESNVAEQFVGIPGSMTTEKPQISIKAREAHVRRPPNQELHSSTPMDVNLFDAGFTFNGLTINTESVEPPGGGTLSGQFVNEPVYSGVNQFTWRLAVDATPPQTAQLNIGIYLPSGELPNYVEGNGAGGLLFTAMIENPVLQIQGINPQQGEANQPLQDLNVVSLTTSSGQWLPDYSPVDFEILEGGGFIAGYSQNGESLTGQTDALTLAGVQWTLGEEGPQRLRAFVDPSGQNILAEVEFQAEIEPFTCPSSIVDLDGNSYPVVQIGEQCWMAENLRTTRYADGDLIPNVQDSMTWFNLTSGAWCNYENSAGVDLVHGKLYNWYAVDDPRNVCPTDWHVASDQEWTELELDLGMSATEMTAIGWRGVGANVGGQLKEPTLWNPPIGTATNSSGVSARPSGLYGDVFYGLGDMTYWWTSTEVVIGIEELAWFRTLLNYENGVHRHHVYLQETGMSVRCVMD